MIHTFARSKLPRQIMVNNHGDFLHMLIVTSSQQKYINLQGTIDTTVPTPYGVRLTVREIIQIIN